MSKKQIILLLTIAIAIALLFGVIEIIFFCKTINDRLDILVTSLTTGIISGFVSNHLFSSKLKQTKLKSISDHLAKYEGSYNIYDWGNLDNIDDQNYKVTINLDIENGIFKIFQTGTTDEHILIGEIKINESTFKFGEGNYYHPKRPGRPIGRIQVYLISDEIINVDKFFLHDSTHLPGSEKWQWRKEKTQS